MEKNKRIDDIDILKAIGIILMILGHIGFGKRLFICQYSFWLQDFCIKKVPLNLPIFLKRNLKL